MSKVIITGFVAIALAIGVLLNVCAIAAAQETPKTYGDVIRSCGTQWRASDARKAVAKGQGMAAWQDFRRECVKTSGYVSKRNRSN